jgi:uncharacterized protein YbjT (DUF2867 family)
MIFITGGTGFVGSYLVKHLLQKGYKLRLLARIKGSSIGSDNPNIEFVKGNVLDSNVLKESMKGCKTVINCVGIIIESKDQTFQKMHFQAVKELVNAAKTNSAEKIIHISALGTSSEPVSEYFRTKYEGEQLIKNSGMKYTIFRPSLLFGKGDNFFPVLKKLASLPITPVIGSGTNRFQPLFIGDLIKCMGMSIEDVRTDNKIFEIGGPKVYTFLEILGIVSKILGKNLHKVNIPVFIMKVFASVFDKLLRQPPITRDQLKMIKVDNITGNNAASQFFKIDLKNLEDGLSEYLKPT